MAKELTLRKLAILHSRNSISDADVSKGLTLIGKVAEHREAGETWFEGNPDNTVAAVQALIGDEITQEEFNNFVRLLD